ncbi:type I methionyl aminopeptidase [Desulfonatronovibrio magnus]|uniref:type I methionyl aminopeptidase n=1 Tax=Desulfonatronovibrio magnus TaxID=698827 RepID=UPI0005EB96C0|nr:type I methionyl aminopeptidase [Desulfonatronovibrio magnus]
MKKLRGIFIKNDYEIGLLREANAIVSYVLDRIEEKIEPGITTMDLEELANDLCRQFKVIPAFKGYQGFPYTLCCSLNDVIVHGFPDHTKLKDGDILSIDMGVQFKGFFGDSARTFAVGTVSQDARKVMATTRSALYKGIEKAVPGNNLYEISAAIQAHAEANECGIIKRFVGHGIGASLHEKPEIPNFVPKKTNRVILKKGMVIAIEPMLSLGSDEVVIMPDRWTAKTKDNSLSAHYEHSVAITSDGPEILSVSKQEFGR